MVINGALREGRFKKGKQDCPRYAYIRMEKLEEMEAWGGNWISQWHDTFDQTFQHQISDFCRQEFATKACPDHAPSQDCSGAAPPFMHFECTWTTVTQDAVFPACGGILMDPNAKRMILLDIYFLPIKSMFALLSADREANLKDLFTKYRAPFFKQGIDIESPVLEKCREAVSKGSTRAKFAELIQKARSGNGAYQELCDRLLRAVGKPWELDVCSVNIDCIDSPSDKDCGVDDDNLPPCDKNCGADCTYDCLHRLARKLGQVDLTALKELVAEALVIGGCGKMNYGACQDCDKCKTCKTAIERFGGRGPGAAMKFFMCSRKTVEPCMDCEPGCDAFTNTISVINSAVKKLARVTHLAPFSLLYRGLANLSFPKNLLTFGTPDMSSEGDSDFTGTPLHGTLIVYVVLNLTREGFENQRKNFESAVVSAAFPPVHELITRKDGTNTASAAASSAPTASTSETVKEKSNRDEAVKVKSVTVVTETSSDVVVKLEIEFNRNIYPSHSLWGFSGDVLPVASAPSWWTHMGSAGVPAGAESAEVALDAFKFFDQNSNGVISKAELQEGMSR